MENFFKQKKGITLIALVITIIVLLILAGISISMLSGDNSILNKGTEAKEKSETAKERETIALAYNAATIKKMEGNESNTVTASELNEELKNQGASAEGDNPIIVKFTKSQRQYTVNPNGKVGEYELAKDKLTLTVNADETVESPYYVNYPSSKGKIKCRVLYNDSTYGLQIVSVNPVTNVSIGMNDPNTNVTGQMGKFARAESSYSRAIMTLNEKAQEYIETSSGKILAIDARCLGSDPINKNYPDNLTGEARAAEMYTSNETYMENYNGRFFKEDNHYETDKNRLDKIGASGFSDVSYGNYFLASRKNSFTINFWNTGVDIRKFYLRLVNSNGVEFSDEEITGIVGVTSEKTTTVGNITSGIRPVFILSPEVKISSGEGTENDPFEIGL